LLTLVDACRDGAGKQLGSARNVADMDLDADRDRRVRRDRNGRGDH
jgi:hypothetical protein